uniref:Uncharacterized protein n=1 Tax=Oryza meridionalis TaxID=40149 RepID=A0A0E0EDK9_9ORYZ
MARGAQWSPGGCLPMAWPQLPGVMREEAKILVVEDRGQRGSSRPSSSWVTADCGSLIGRYALPIRRQSGANVTSSLERRHLAAHRRRRCSPTPHASPAPLSLPGVRRRHRCPLPLRRSPSPRVLHDRPEIARLDKAGNPLLCSATFSPSSISLEFHIPDDWICEKDEALEHQGGMPEILRHTKKAPATKEVLLSFPPSPMKQ